MTVCAVCSASQRERQAQREDALELTEKLDRDWGEIQALLARKAPQLQDGDRQERAQVGMGAGGGGRVEANTQLP